MREKLKIFYTVTFWMTLLGILMFLADFGFSHSESSQRYFNTTYFVVLAMSVVATVVRYVDKQKSVRAKVFAFDGGSVLFSLFLFYIHLFEGQISFLSDLFYFDFWVKIALFLAFIREFSEIRLNYKRTVLNPAQLFIISFMGIIFVGSLLLMLPNATVNGISFVDAIFTSTSAVCVTGLIVVDTATYFTEFGQLIIMFLIQAGGLGILTFASYFSYFFKGGSTYENQLALSDMTSSKKLGEVFKTLKYIILITFTIELLAAVSIYFSIEASQFESMTERLFFSIFHAVSAFCNAGFSTLTNSIYEEGFRFNYYLQLIIGFTFIFGGLGFPIVANLLEYFKYRFLKLLRFGKYKAYRPWVLNLNSRITLFTTLSLTAVAFVLFYFLEYNNTLAEHSEFGKVVTAFFGAATPRTAGFNSVDTSALQLPTLMMVFLLMWIGASPASTGGGIKTSTFAIASLNILSLAKGKQRIEVFRREIADISVRRAFAIIALSLIVIGFGIMSISIFDPEKELMDVAFECFSAYSTVGLSLGITGDLSEASKVVIMIVMFVGRVSMLSIIIAVFKKVRQKNYRYPTEEITIN